MYIFKKIVQFYRRKKTNRFFRKLKKEDIIFVGNDLDCQAKTLEDALNKAKPGNVIIIRT